MKYNVEINKTRIKAIVVIVLIAICFILAFEILTAIEKKHDEVQASEYNEKYESKVKERDSIYFRDSKYYYRDGIQTVLIIGVDKFEDTADAEQENRNNMQSDFLFLVVYDKASGDTTAIHIDRDSVVKLPLFDIFGKESGTTNGQIALSHTYGSGKQDSCEYTVDAVSDYLYGVKIDHYVALEMDAVPVVNDMLDGIRVVIRDDMTAVDPSFIAGSEVTLSGENALKFVRARGELEDSSNTSRMVRQRDYIESLIYSYNEKENDNPDLSLDVLFSINNYLTSDCNLNQLAQIIDLIVNFDVGGGIQTIEGESSVVGGYTEFHPDEEKLKELVVSIFYEKSEEQTQQ